MTASSGNLAAPLEPARREKQAQEELQAHRVLRYTYRVTAILIVLCNAVILLGVWVSGVNLDTLFTTPDRFNAAKDICVRLSWHKVAGVERPVQLCYEWINLSDSSGDTHRFQAETQVVKGADGKLYYDEGVRVDYRVFVLSAFVAAVVALGVTLKRYLIARYRGRLPTRVNEV
jgi:hypothetical protein